MNVDVLILLESKERELEGACLLKEELKSRGYSVLVKSVYPNKESLPFKYNAKIVITPWAYNNNDMKLFTCFYKNGNTKILNLHHEQYSGNNSENACLPKQQAKEIFHISWGEEFTKELLKTGCERKKICQSGNIRLDFFRKEFRSMSKNKNELAKEFGIDSNKKWVLFIANGYHLADKKGISNMSSIDKNAKIKAEVSKKTRLEFLKYIEEYLAENDDTIFIYRPHPVYSFLDINQPEIKRLCEKYPKNFFCIFKYPIRYWIMNIDTVLSFHSTSGVECYVAKKNYVLFRPFAFDSKIDYEFYKDYPYVIKDYNDFIKYINLKEYITKKDVYKEYFEIKDKECTYIAICNFIDKIIKEADSDDNCNKINTKWYIYIYAKMIIKKLIIFLAKNKLFKKIILRTGDTRIKHIIKNDDDFISDKEMENISNKIKKVIGEN